MVRSFLARLAVPQQPRPSERTRYDVERDELLVRREGRWVAAIDADVTPKSKKADIEKGEDRKDQWF